MTEPTESWDVVLEGRLPGDPSFKARVKRYTMRDSLAKSQLEVELAEEIEQHSGSDLEMLFTLNHYPLIRFGIAAAEGFDASPLSRDTFWSLPEQFVLNLAEAIREANPQYSLPFVDLRRLIDQASPKDDKVHSTSIVKKGKKDKTPSTGA